MSYAILLVYGIVVMLLIVWMVDQMKKAKLPKCKKVDFSSAKKIQVLIDKWRNIIGVDPVYLISLKVGITEDPALINNPAWIEGLGSENKHPSVTICVNANWLEQNKYDEYEINSTIVHELTHIICFDAFVMADSEYRYEGMKARAAEIITMKITSAIMKVAQTE